MNLTSESIVSEIAVAFPNTIRIFEQHHMDYCCNGNQSISQACAKQNVVVDVLINQLKQATQKASPSDLPDWTKTSLTELVYHILKTHHRYLSRELPHLHQILSKVINVHGKQHPESLTPLGKVFGALEAELADHMFKEERILFPLIQDMETAKEKGTPLPQSACGSVNNPIRVMLCEHENAGNALAEIRRLTNDYTPPEDACTTYRALFSGLLELEQDLHQHIHLENNILFPRAIALENETTT